MTDPSTSQAAADRLGPLTDSLQQTTLPACVRDAGGRYVAVNPAFADLVGLEASRVVGKTDNALQPADVAHKVAELDALVLEAHGHLDANETVLARDGRRTVRACRFPVYTDGEAWGICVVMSPGDDPEAGREARERLQSSVGQIGSSGVTAPSEELMAERDRAAAADAEAFSAREALAVEREARLEAEIAARAAADELDSATEALKRASERVATLESERNAAADRAQELDQSLGQVGERQQHLDEELAEARARAEAAEAEVAALQAAGEAGNAELNRELEALRAAYNDLQAAGEDAEEARERYGDDLAKALAEQKDLQRLFDEAVASRDEMARDLEGLRQRFDRAEKELEEERSRGEWLSVELQAAQHRERDADEAVEDAELRRRQLEQSLQSANDRAEELQNEILELRAAGEIAEASQGELERALQRADDAEAALEEARARTESGGEQLHVTKQALESAEASLADALRSRDEVGAKLDEAIAARDSALADRDEAVDAREVAVREKIEATELLQHAGATTHAEVAVLREELSAAHQTIDELRAALEAERATREALARQLAEAEAAPAPAPATVSIEVPSALESSTALPSLAVAAEQASQFAHAATDIDAGPPPGLTDELVSEFDGNLDRASSPRSAGRAALNVMATATGWVGGVLWLPGDEDGRVFTCQETWTEYGSALQAWETMAWRAHLEDGLVPAAAGSGAAHWAETEEMLACPRSRAADWAQLGTLVTIPAVGAEGEVLAVLELVRSERQPADETLLTTLMGIGHRLAARLAEIQGEVTDSAPAGRM